MDILVENLFSDPQQQAALKVPGFLVRSTAPTNVEDEEKQEDQDQPTIQDLIEILYRYSQTGQDLGVVIAIHGYNTGNNDAEEDGVLENWYQPLCQYIGRDRFISEQKGNLLFLGYRWPSENIANQGNWRSAFKALPKLLGIGLYGGLAIAFISGILLVFNQQPVISGLVAIAGMFLFALMFCLLLLRISLYFRDVYRSTYFGVPDLIELVRQLDQGLMQRRIQEVLTDEELYRRIVNRVPETNQFDPAQFLTTIKLISQALRAYRDLEINPSDREFQTFLNTLKPQLPLAIDDELLLQIIQRMVLIESLEKDAARYYWKQHSVELSLLGHSMGGAVTTQVIRVLSDIFDPQSVGEIGNTGAYKKPSSKIGNIFRLGRLILVSPDIPVLTITSGRSNFLRSALRRFEEAYLFSNEGDLALRLASTAANYFSFPARTNTQGYRLGNVTVSPKEDPENKFKRRSSNYGILNLDEIEHQGSSALLEYLEINVLGKSDTQRLDPASQQRKGEEAVASGKVDQESIADLFTYFDCTEYCDRTDYNETAKTVDANVLILNKQRSPLNFFGYLRLMFAFATFSKKSFPKGGRDVHGGYFAGQFSKFLMYRLAFLGMQRFLDSLLFTETSEFGIEPPLPPPLATAITTAQQSTQHIDWDLAYTSPLLLPPEQLQRLQTNRQAALRYCSWLLAQKHIQSVFSAERYQVDVLGGDRSQTRERVLTKQVSPPASQSVQL